MKHRLENKFFARDTHTVAWELLGKLMVRKWRGKVFEVRINEVESYVGENDKACHAHKGKTKRNEVMFGNAGFAYVYLIYGMYHCLNVVTERKEFPAAVLIRGAGNYDGPGKLCRELKISRAQNGEDLVRSEKLFIADDGFRVEPRKIVTTPRINVDYAGEDAKLPWRYVLTRSE